MAYTINNGAIMSVIFRGTMYGQDVMNTFHYRYDGPVIASGLTFLTNLIGVNAQMQANMALWQDCISEDVVDNRVIGQWIYPLRYRPWVIPMANATGNSGPAGTANLASVISLIADRATRHGIGNKHIPGLAINSQTLGFLTAGQLANNGSFGTAMATSVPILGGVMQPVIYNRLAPPDSLEVVGSEQNPTVRVQRRRTVGLGK